MIAATRIALAVGRLNGIAAKRITTAISNFGRLPSMKVQTTGVMKRLQSDKKTRQGVVHFVLPTQIGKVEIVNDVPTTVVRSAVEEIRKLSLK
jgi:3-dehydroquinate synthase